MKTLMDEILYENSDLYLLTEIPWWHLPARDGRWYLIEKGNSLLKVAEREWKLQGLIPNRKEVYDLALIINNHPNNEYLRRLGKISQLFPKGQVTFNPLFGHDRRTRAKRGEKRFFGVLFIPRLNLNPSKG